MSALLASTSADRRLRKAASLAYVVAIVMWLVSLVLPAAEVNGSLELAGHRAFVIGIDALRSGIPGWLANPLAFAAVIAGLFGRFAIATSLAAGASVLGLSSLWAPASARADGVPIDAVAFKVGFFLWLAACSLIFAASAFGWLRSRQARPQR